MKKNLFLSVNKACSSSSLFLCLFYCLIVLFFTFIVGSASLEATSKLQVEYDKKIGVDDVLELTIKLINQRRDPQVESVDFQIIANPSYRSSISITAGNIRREKTLIYMLQPTRTGQLTFTVRLSASDQTNCQVQVVSASILSNQSNKKNRSRNRLPSRNSISRFFFDDDDIHLDPEDVLIKNVVSKSQAFVNEPILLETILYYRTHISTPRYVKYDNLLGFSSKEIHLSKNASKPTSVTIDGKRYESIVMRKRIIYGHYAGQFILIGGKLLVEKVRNHFFHGPEMQINIPNIPMRIVKFPEENQPADFYNAYGDFSLEVKSDVQSVKVYEPLKVIVTVAGSGNFNSLILPEFSAKKDAPYIISKETTQSAYGWTQSTYRGKKWTIYYLIPQKITNFELENLSFSYYSQSQDRYITLTNPSEPQSIAVVENPDAPEEITLEVNPPEKELKIFATIHTEPLLNEPIITNFFLSQTSFIIHSVAILLVLINALAFLFRERVKIFLWKLYPVTTSDVARKKNLLYIRTIFLIKKSLVLKNQEVFVKRLETSLRDYLFSAFSVDRALSLYELKKIISKKIQDVLDKNDAIQHKNKLIVMQKSVDAIALLIEQYQNFLYARKSKNISENFSPKKEVNKNLKLLASTEAGLKILTYKI